jgi:hypothetical protein
MYPPVLLTCIHLFVTGLPVIAALWGMALVAYGYEWHRYQEVVRGARLAPATAHWLVIEQGPTEYARSIRCQELIIRRYSCQP